MTKNLRDYITGELKYLKEVNGAMVDTTTDKKYLDLNKWMSENFNYTLGDYQKAMGVN